MVTDCWKIKPFINENTFKELSGESNILKYFGHANLISRDRDSLLFYEVESKGKGSGKE